ncbi:MAG: hypothetical protein ACOZEN_06900 [Thermodesulfobacteriota bacterium]
MPRTAILLAAVLLCLAGCQSGEPLHRVFESAKGGIRFHPARDWTVEEKDEPGCIYAAEASKGQELRFVVCVSPPRPDLLFTQNTFVSCENLKEYIVKDLKGLTPFCGRGGTGTLFGYDTLYARLVRSGGKVRMQFVNHLFIPARGRLIQVMSMAVADDRKTAQELFEQNRAAFFAMMGSVREL